MKLTNEDFRLVEVHEKPSRRYRKGSKYDPIIDKFMSGKSSLVKVEVEGKDANYVRTQLKKRIDARVIGEKLEVSVVNNVAYLEKK
jgi:hypothetical protein